MSHLWINQLKNGDLISEVYKFKKCNSTLNKNGNPYLYMTLADRTGMMDAKFWDPTQKDIDTYRAGDYVHIEGTVQLFKGNLQVIIRRMSQVDPEKIDTEDYDTDKKLDLANLMQRLTAALHSITSPDLLNLADSFLADEEFMNRFKKTPGGKFIHHAYPGGLLEHTVRMIEIAQFVSKLYAGELDGELLIMGTFLHDIGKTEEIVKTSEEIEYTDVGQLIGHHTLGVSMLDDKIKEAEMLSGTPFPPKTALLLRHMIISHHGQQDFGSPCVPMTVEAIALHCIDMLDAKVMEFRKNIEEDTNTNGSWTTYFSRLERRLYKETREK